MVDYGLSLGGRVTHVASFREAVASMPGGVPEALSQEKRQALWERLVTYNILGGNSRTVTSIVRILQGDALLQKLEELSGETILPQGFFEAPVVLPETIFPLPLAIIKETTTPTPPTEPDGNKTAIQDALQNAADIERVTQNLLAAFQITLEFERQQQIRQYVPIGPEGSEAPPQNPPDPGPTELEVAQKVFSKLSDEDKAVLEKYSLTALPVPLIVNLLERKRAGFTTTIAEKLQLNTQLTQIGTALVEPPLLKGIATKADTVKGSVPEKPPVLSEDTGRTLWKSPACRVKPWGIADSRRVEQKLICYKAGEIAHIENIMKGQGKERTTRRLDRTEDTSIFTEERETTEERDTITTDRFQLEKETGRIVMQDTALGVGVTLSAQYGPVKLDATTSFSTNSSSTQSDAQAVAYGKDVTERALQRVSQRTSEQQIHKVLQEFEETNKHSVDNTTGDSHIVGLYRWVDKVYEARVVNYGKRLMFEFMVPEPAAFHRYAMENRTIVPKVSINKPLDPVNGMTDIQALFPGIGRLTSPAAIDRTNYLWWAGLYNVKVDAPPPYVKRVGIALAQNNMSSGNKLGNLTSNQLAIPEGYYASSAIYGLTLGFAVNQAIWLTIAVGEDYHRATGWGPVFRSMAHEEGVLPISITGNVESFTANIEVACICSQEYYDAWRVKTYNAIMAAYQVQLSEYNNAIAEARTQMGGIEIRGMNPGLNRIVEQTELKKQCIRLLSGCSYSPSNAMQENYLPEGYPDFDCCAAIEDGKYVQFVENCFEWQIMTYNFYPYFYSRRSRWKTVYQLTDNDPVFQQFLQAGYARVVVPVRPGYEAAAMRFAADGTIWNGGTVPGINDPLYVEIINEMRTPVVKEVGEPWEIRVPTMLTILQKDASGIDESGLPCDPDGIGS